MRMKCTKCRGAGEFLPPHGITKADLVKCHICNGEGIRPEGYKTKTDGSRSKRVRYFSKRDGLEDLKELEAE